MKRTGLLLQLTIFGLCSYLITTVNTQEVVSDAICNSVTFPITGSISYARDSPSPLKFKLQSRSYKPSTPFNIVISSSQKIQSFYMQAFQPGSAQPVGFFVYKYSDGDVIVSDCPTENEARELGKSTLSDPNDFRPRKQISIYWTSNNTVTGLVVFKITATTEDQVVWSGLTSYEVTSSVKECITGSGSDYRGTVAHTVDDVPCQRWDSQTPHRQIVGNKYDFTVSDFCRNPDKDDSPWCFLSRNDTGKRFGKCNIRKCTDAIDEMVEFGVPNGDTPIPLTNDSSQVIPLTFPLHLVSRNYTHFKVFECGVIAMGTSASVLQILEMDEEAEVKSSKFNASLGHVMAFTVFWSKIDRTDSDIGSGHVYFRQSNKESDLRLVSSTMGPLIRRKLNNESSEFTAKWVFIATWYLVGDKKNSENTFQSIIVTDKQRTFLMYDFDMTDDWEDEAKALIGYSEGDGFQFLNKTTPSSLETRFEQADQLSVSATSFSNVNDTGKWLYDISPCARQLENGHEKCEKTLTLVLGNGKSVPKITTVSVPPEDPLSHCENGGTPIQGGENGYPCTCPDGFTGELCEINIDECNSNPCNNNATCEDGINSFECRCKSGFTGLLCDSDINECISNPCINGGVCKSLINDYECRCPVLYTGKNCENYQDPCIQEEDFCKNGGTCVSNGTVLGCKCAIGFSGKTCEQVIPVTTRSTEEYGELKVWKDKHSKVVPVNLVSNHMYKKKNAVSHQYLMPKQIETIKEQKRYKRQLEDDTVCIPMTSTTQCFDYIASSPYQEYPNIGMPIMGPDGNRFTEEQWAKGQIDLNIAMIGTCHDWAKYFICSSFLPKCNNGTGAVVLTYPCRSMCQTLEPLCASKLSLVGLTWNEMFNCDFYPNDGTQNCFSSPPLKPETTVAPTTIAPTTIALTTVSPTTIAPTTVAPTTIAPTTIFKTTIAPTTVAPTIIAPTTISKTTFAPTTVVPTKNLSTTFAPTTSAPKTVASTTIFSPTTVAAITTDQTTVAPTVALTTVAPITTDPTTVAPTTISSTTVEPTTVIPTTVAPKIISSTTVAPTTVAPTKNSSTTVAPSTAAPITAVKTTTDLTTVAPITVAQTTISTTTVAPTTVAPTKNLSTPFAPTTSAPKTVASTTIFSTTVSPTTVAAITTDQTTVGPTTVAQTTVGPITTDPTTVAPTTISLTTVSPKTIALTTVTPTTPAPNINAQTTVSSTTVALTTIASTTVAAKMISSTTVAPSTAAPITVAPKAISSTTVAPTAVSPTTVTPTTISPTTISPLTISPTTVAATTSDQTTMAPTTNSSTTVALTTVAPIMTDQTTVAPTTVAPTTVSSTAVLPTTIAPTTVTPTTYSPTTIAQTTISSTTAAPTTISPLTVSPTTVAATTSDQTTVAPTTISPTTVVLTTVDTITTDPTTVAQTTVSPTTNSSLIISPTTFFATTSDQKSNVSTTVALTTVDTITTDPTTVAQTTVTPTTISPTTISPLTVSSTTVAATKSDQTTVAPTTVALTTVAPITTAATTVSPTIFAPKTIVPTTIASTTAFLVPTTVTSMTVASTTVSPTTVAPTIVAPTTIVPTTTVVPTTTAPTTVAPTTVALATVTLTTVASTNVAPSTAVPTSVVPTTILSTNVAPTTVFPTNITPTTIAPTTIAPTTVAPTTIAPTTVAKTTVAPTKVALTTVAQSTAAPTEIAPTSIDPTTIAPTISSKIIAPTTVDPTTVSQNKITSTSIASSKVTSKKIPPTTVESTVVAPNTLGPTTVDFTTVAPTNVDLTTDASTEIGWTTITSKTAAPATISQATAFSIAQTTDTPTEIDQTIVALKTDAQTINDSIPVIPTSTVPTTTVTLKAAGAESVTTSYVTKTTPTELTTETISSTHQATSFISATIAKNTTETSNSTTKLILPDEAISGAISQLSETITTLQNKTTTKKQETARPTNQAAVIEIQSLSESTFVEQLKGEVCPSDRTGSDINGYIYWEPVAAGLQQTAFCPNPTNGIATRQCTEFGWLSPNESFCYRLSESSQKILKLFEAEINEDNVEEMADQLATVTGEFSNELTAYDIKNVAIIVKKLISATASSIAQPTATGVIKSVSNVMFAPEYEIERASMNSTAVTDLATTVEETLANVETIGGNVLQINSENLLTAVAPVNDISTFTGQYFSFSVDTRVDVGGGHRYIDELGSDIRAAINIPASLALEATEPLTRIQCAVYTSKALFQNVDTSKVRTNGSMDANIKLFGDYVISGKVGNQQIQNLSDKITIIISNLQTNYYGGERLCAYLENEGGGINASSGSWLTDGCIVVSSTSTHTVMETDHLTNFAVIMDVYGTTKKLSKTHLMILQIVTTVGCSVSIFGLFCTLLSYLLFEKLRKDNPSKILISFCIALMFLNTVFLCLQPSYLSGNKIVCKAVACILHYFLLSTLMWMGIEAINMYFALVKVFNIYYRRYILKVSLIGWGVPGIFLGATFVTEKLTGLESYQVFEYNEICWLRTPLFYGTLVGPFGFVFLANCIIYYLVLRQILGMSSRKLGEQNSRRSIKQNKKESFRRLRGAIGIMVLLGLSWGFAFVMIESATLLFAYIFVAANSSQGFWIFLFHCYLKQEVVVAWKRLLFKKGSFMRDGSANRWSRWSASSSATRGSRLINSSSARSLSALATKPHPYLVPRFENVDQREKSVGPSPKMTENLLEEMGYVNNSFTDMNEIGPPPSMPPPSPPGYWDENTKRLVRKVPKKVGNIDARTICTQTTFPDPSQSDSISNSDASSDLSHDSSHQEDMLHGHSVRVGCETDSNVENELQDSVGEHFVRPFSLPMHREVAMSPSNESGVYSDTSASNQPSVQQRQLEEHFAALEHLEAPPDMNNLHSGNVELSTVTNSSDPPRTNLVQANGSIKGRYNNVLSEYHQKYAQIQGRRISQKHYNHIPIVVTNGDTSSTAYCSGTESRGSMSSQASSSDYENKNETNFKSWQPPLVIKRSDNVAEENGKESPIPVNKFRKLNKNHSTDQFKLKKSKGSRANSPPVKRKHRLKKRNMQSTLS